MTQERELSDIPHSQQTLEQALKIDPGFAEALRYHAFEYVLLLLNGFSNDRGVLSKAEEELRLVEKLDPNLASLPGAYAALYLAQGHKDRIDIAKLNRLIKERTDVPSNKNWRMIMNVFAEENNEAKLEASELLAAKKTFAAPRLYLGDVYRREKHIQDAIKEQQWILDHASSNMPAIRYLALAYMDNHEYDKAHALLEEKRSLSENFLLRMAWALLYAVQGNRKEANIAMNEDLQKFAGATFTVTSEVAEFYAVLNEPDKAVDWLQKAVDNGDERSDWFVQNERLKSLWKNDKFVRIINNINSNKAKRRQQTSLNHN
jgi:tetratricopeptide (TPR) repeat protein